MKETSSYKIEPELRRKLKVHCAKKDMSLSLFIEQAVKKKMEEDK